MANGHTNLKATNPNGQELSVSHTTTDSPILPAANLAQLKEIDPSLVSWVVNQTAAEATHRRTRQSTVDMYLFIERMAGVIIGGVVALSGLGLAAYVALQGHDWVAAVVGGSTLVAIVSVLVARKSGSPPKHETPSVNKTAKKK